MMRTTRFLTLALAITALSACSKGAVAPAFKSIDRAVNDTQVEELDQEEPSTSAKPSVSASLQKMTYQLGPYDLPSGQDAETNREKPYRITFNVDEPVWITAFEPRIEDSNGEALPGALLHLAIVSNHSEENPLCTSERSGNPFMAATSSLKKITLPEGHGYALLPDDKLEATVILQNPTDQDFRDVYFRFTLMGHAMNSGKQTADITPLLLDADPCSHNPLAVEPGGYVKKSERFSIPESGNLVAAYGLLQTYGVEVGLAKESDSSPFWKAAATQNANHHVTALPKYENEEGIPLKNGDGVVLTVSYQNFSDKWFNDATAAAIVYIARSDDQDALSTAKPFNTKKAAASTAVQAMLIQ